MKIIPKKLRRIGCFIFHKKYWFNHYDHKQKKKWKCKKCNFYFN